MEQVLNTINSVPAPVESLHKEQLKTRVDSYDVARAVAVIGMVLVNYDAIFVHANGRSMNWMGAVANFLSGRAAALFVMLAGVGIALMAQKAFNDNDHEKMQHIRYSLLKRSFFLLISGFFFMQFWKSDVLHFYAVYLVIGAWILHCRVSFFVRLTFVNTILFFALFWLMQGEVELPDIQGADWALEAIDDFFFSGLYAVIPWSTFMFIGILLVRGGLIYDRPRLYKTFVSALFVFVFISVFQRQGILYLDNAPEGWLLAYLEPLFLADSFPISPLFFISSVATSLMVVSALLLLAKASMLQNLYTVLKDTGRCSLTIYVGHIFLGKALNLATKKLFPVDHYNLVFQFSVIASLLLIISFAKHWTKYHRYGPLELCMRRLTSSN